MPATATSPFSAKLTDRESVARAFDEQDTAIKRLESDVQSLQRGSPRFRSGAGDADDRVTSWAARS